MSTAVTKNTQPQEMLPVSYEPYSAGVTSVEDLSDNVRAMIRAAQEKNADAVREALEGDKPVAAVVDASPDAVGDVGTQASSVDSGAAVGEVAATAPVTPAPAAVPEPAEDVRLKEALSQIRPLEVELQRARDELKAERAARAAIEQPLAEYASDRVTAISKVLAGALGTDDPAALREELRELHDELTYKLLDVPVNDDTRKAKREAARATAIATKVQREREAERAEREAAETQAREQQIIDAAITGVGKAIDANAYPFLARRAQLGEDPGRIVFNVMAEARMAKQELTLAQAASLANQHFQNEAKRVYDAYASLFAQPAPAPAPAATPAVGPAPVVAPGVGVPQREGTSDAPRSKTLTNQAAATRPTRPAVDVEDRVISDDETIAKIGDLLRRSRAS